jgi:NAD(P)H dehydrogenase (quinone)
LLQLPYGTSVTVDQSGKMVEDFSAIQAAVKHQAKRTVTVTDWVKRAKNYMLNNSVGNLKEVEIHHF